MSIIVVDSRTQLPNICNFIGFITQSQLNSIELYISANTNNILNVDYNSDTNTIVLGVASYGKWKEHCTVVNTMGLPQSAYAVYKIGNDFYFINRKNKVT